MNFKSRFFGGTHKGLIRKKNEDFWGVIQDQHFFVLADGMGGHRAGDVAAQEAVEALTSIIKQKFKLIDKEADRKLWARQVIHESIKEVNAIVYSISASDSELRGMGTTLCCLYLQPDWGIIAHVGDSRIYRFRSGKLSQLTKDHSLAHELQDLGQLDALDVGRFTHKNIITKAVGNDIDVEPTLEVEKTEKNDLYLLCSDGLTDMVSPEEIQYILSRSASIDEGGESLIRAALKHGGHDNVTVVLAGYADNLP